MEAYKRHPLGENEGGLDDVLADHAKTGSSPQSCVAIAVEDDVWAVHSLVPHVEHAARLTADMAMGQPTSDSPTLPGGSVTSKGRTSRG
jgi:hypothetical protein